jgi:hypothetical protein
VPGQLPAQAPVERLDSDDLADTAAVDGQPDGPLEHVFRGDRADAPTLEEEGDALLTAGDAGKRRRAPCDEGALDVG